MQLESNFRRGGYVSSPLHSWASPAHFKVKFQRRSVRHRAHPDHRCCFLRDLYADNPTAYRFTNAAPVANSGSQFNGPGGFCDAVLWLWSRHNCLARIVRSASRGRSSARHCSNVHPTARFKGLISWDPGATEFQCFRFE